MFHLVFLIIISYIAYPQTTFQLEGPLPLNIDCKISSSIENGLIGNQYFYNYMTKNGTLLSLDKITFHMWMQFHSELKSDARQIIFCFFDGNKSNINVMLYFRIENDLTYLYFENKIQKFNSTIRQYINRQLKVWNHLLVSIDKSTENTFINLKFFTVTDNPQLFQSTETLTNQKIPYNFGSRSRITNEKITEKDIKACINIANFYYINGWATMDTEFYFDFDLQLKFALKPYSQNGIIVSNIFSDIVLRKQTEYIEYSGSIGINLYKNTQIVYNFIEQLPTLTIIFWVKPQNILSSFQFLSFTDDVLQETSIGFGVNKFYNLLFYQIYNKTPVCNLTQNIWNHVTIGILDISFDDDFEQLNQRKLMRIFIDNVQRNLTVITNIKPYKRLVLGPVFLDDQGLEIIDIQDIKIFKGFGIRQTLNHDCLIFVGDYCAFCKSGTHYCKEQDPNDDTKVYPCPAGYKEQQNSCSKIIIPNCLRLSSSSLSCDICEQNYALMNGQCIQNSVILSSPFKCSDQNAQFCSFNQTLNVLSNTLDEKQVSKQISKLCTNNLYSSSQLKCTGAAVSSCLKSQFNSKCTQCNNNNVLTELKEL
ncbi:unnamed protein product [Paramecium pentaurelia]|uniref:Uncharacterized protein n=1 Tax=Paramecium pentaurelia TaxID=43138 RepID=A0A8S1S5B5_9CILI|nr:unnamed protein product [Paramecium pentaurelia]